jgi:formylmethanofuran dehydrogenase subunit E
MTDINDAPTLACDHCGVPVVMTDLVPFKSEHVCRFCYERAHGTTHRHEAKGSMVFEDWP